ncbi:MAG: GNAT family N-acetyltransferase [Anaerolineaceae bacterium]|nr:GNAT family N-acetyltransferase [Anaerolineaceae bacterium]
MTQFTIRPLTSHDDYQLTRQIHMAAWGVDAAETLPPLSMHAFQHNGGILLGAYDGDQLVGYILSTLGTVETPGRIDQIAAARLKLFSVIMGILPAYQGQGIGTQLKLAQREAALRLGIRMITWTYDPLESRNGRLNIGKLGAICNRYYRDFHGPMAGRNAGLASDRFEVEWWVTSNRVEGRVAQQRRPLSLDAMLGAGAVVVNEATFDDGLLIPPLDFARSDNNLLLVEIPSDIQGLKAADLALARQWRQHTRQLFEYYFAANFAVTDFVFQPGGDGRSRSFYLLTHNDS